MIVCQNINKSPKGSARLERAEYLLDAVGSADPKLLVVAVEANLGERALAELLLRCCITLKYLLCSSADCTAYFAYSEHQLSVAGCTIGEAAVLLSLHCFDRC